MMTTMNAGVVDEMERGDGIAAETGTGKRKRKEKGIETEIEIAIEIETETARGSAKATPAASTNRHRGGTGARLQTAGITIEGGEIGVPHATSTTGGIVTTEKMSSSVTRIAGREMETVTMNIVAPRGTTGVTDIA